MASTAQLAAFVDLDAAVCESRQTAEDEEGEGQKYSTEGQRNTPTRQILFVHSINMLCNLRISGYLCKGQITNKHGEMTLKYVFSPPASFENLCEFGTHTPETHSDWSARVVRWEL